jgi:hypothetical protein
MKTNQNDSELTPLTKSDWIRFGALKVQAKNKRVWQAIAIISMIGLASVITTDALLWMKGKLEYQRMASDQMVLSNQNRQQANKLNSLNGAISQYERMINMTRTEKDQLTIEKGILHAQVDLLLSKIDLLETRADRQTEEPEAPLEKAEPITDAAEQAQVLNN